VTLLKKFNTNTPSWDEILKNLNHCVLNNFYVKHKPTAFWVAHNAEKIIKVKNVYEELKAKSAHLYINIHCKSKTFGEHQDEVDVAFWQIKGISRWIINKQEYIVNEGDLIKVSKGIPHSVYPLNSKSWNFF
jgi:mannose-6-phosphate isomerase-like protein (cupin superfamily)